MFRILLPFSAVLAACTPSPKDAAMRHVSPTPHDAVTPDRGTPGQAAQGPMPAAVSAAGGPAPGPGSSMDAPLGDAPDAALGRRILSTAFVRVGPDGHLTVELRDGRALVLRDVVMGPNEYCGVQVVGSAPGKRHCGGYAAVAAARPGGAR